MLLLVANGFCFAQEPPAFAEGGDESAQYQTETVVSGLDGPSSVAVRPASPRGGPFEMFIAERGAGRVVRWTTDGAAAPAAVIAGFPVAPAPAADAPLALDFLSRDWLAVGTGGANSQVRVYQLPIDGAPLDHQQADHALGPLGASDRSEQGERDFASLAHQNGNFFVASRGGDPRGWVLRATLDSNQLAGLEPFIPTRERTGRGRPAAVLIDPRPRRHYLLVALRGGEGPERDSRVAWFSPKSGQLALNLNVGLNDVVGLAYSPTGELYAIDDSASDAHPAGVYRLDAAQVDGRESCRAALIAEVPSPTALVFTPDGALYVATGGESSDDSDGEELASPRGALLRIKSKTESAPQ